MVNDAVDDALTLKASIILLELRLTPGGLDTRDCDRFGSEATEIIRRMR